MLYEHFIPFPEGPFGDHSVDDKWVALNELLRRFTMGEHAHCTFKRICKRPCHQEHAPCVKFAKASSVGGDVGLSFGHAVRCDLIKHDDFHDSSAPLESYVART